MLVYNSWAKIWEKKYRCDWPLSPWQLCWQTEVSTHPDSECRVFTLLHLAFREDPRCHTFNPEKLKPAAERSMMNVTKFWESYGFERPAKWISIWCLWPLAWVICTNYNTLARRKGWVQFNKGYFGKVLFHVKNRSYRVYFGFGLVWHKSPLYKWESKWYAKRKHELITYIILLSKVATLKKVHFFCGKINLPKK